MSASRQHSRARMVCKNCAAMSTNSFRLLPSSVRLLLLAGLCAAVFAAPAQAEKADRLKKLVIASDRGGIIDLVKQSTEFNGDVVLSKGTMLLRAEKVDVRETSDGYFQAYASGQTGKQVSFRQARDVPGEAIDGAADQVEYDTRADTVRFVGNAVVRRTQGTQVATEVTGAVIVFDNRSEVFTVDGGPASPHPTGRVRMVMMPSAPAAADTKPAAPAGSSATSPPALQPSLILQPRKPS